MLSRIHTDVQHCLRCLQTVAGSREPDGVEMPEIVRIGSKSYAAFVSDIPADPQLVAGGEVDVAKFTVWVLKSELATEPKIGCDCIVRGETYQLLAPISDKQAFFELTVGDYAA